MIKWVVLTILLWIAVNWFLVPSFPVVREWLTNGFTLYHSAGLSALVMVLAMLFGNED